MDNFKIDVTAEKRPSLDLAMQLAFAHNAPGKGAKGYVVTKEHGLIFVWVCEVSPQSTPFPFIMDAAGCADFAARWLTEQDYGREPDHDGDNGKGWRLYTEAWGHVGPYHYAICAIKPAWAMYGK